ncbi:uncharacterized protein K444DRAFT_63375 [Hyaloscypha bicolor E]|uniref:Uncharacterized protein n=1 Tax=Hyaloscypha bicolor E TaxID=1095630 RepID=A0A2J6T075_9HELO|nr:uncharacterized protein K444DRAFT_63375 [Hyaloscypha bicolor E]PMD56414.1 hypothetical protein K444DRAFT_63375 [Hyaloscypha bicolor E]
MPQTAPRLSSTCLSCHIREEYCICIAAEAIVLRRVEKQRRGPACHFHVIIPAALVAGEAQRPPREEKKHCSYCSHTPGRALVWVDEAPFLEASVATLDSPPPAVSSPSSPSILRPDVSLFTAEDRRRKRKEVCEKSACMVLAWLGWLVTTAEGFEVYQRSYRRPTSVPSRNLREHLSIIPLLEQWSAAVPCGWRWELKGERREVEKRPALRCLVPTK